MTIDAHETASSEAPESVVRRGLRLVRAHVRLHPGPFSVAVAGAALFALFTVGATVVLGRVTDDVIVPTFTTGEIPDNALPYAVLAVMAVTVLRVVGVVTRRYFAGMTAERVQMSIRHQLVDQYLGLPMSWHHDHPTGELLAHADSDTEVSTEVLHPLPFSLGVAFLALFAGISLVLVDPILALVALAIFPALTLLNRFYSRRVEAPAAKVQSSVGKVSAVAHESFDGALVVKTLGRGEAEAKRFDEATDELRSNRVTVGYIRAMFEPVLDTLPSLGIVAVVLVGVARIEAGAVRPGELVQVASLFTVLAFPMRVLGFFLEMMPPSVVANERIAGVMQARHEAQPRQDRPLGDGALDVAVSNVDFGFAPGTPVLTDVTFSVRPGEVVAVVGSTASGKSTLTNLLAGLVRPDAGTVRIDGLPVESISSDQRTRAIGLVFQESFLFADSLRSNIDVDGPESTEAIMAAADLAQIARFIEGLPEGLDTVVGERGVTLSGGQRQRVALARALLRKPQVLILDDATSAVDPLVEQEILGNLHNNLSMTTIVVAQRVSTMELADRIVYLADGSVAGVGSQAELMNLPGYAALVTAYEEQAV